MWPKGWLKKKKNLERSGLSFMVPKLSPIAIGSKGQAWVGFESCKTSGLKETCSSGIK